MLIDTHRALGADFSIGQGKTGRAKPDAEADTPESPQKTPKKSTPHADRLDTLNRNKKSGKSHEQLRKASLNLAYAVNNAREDFGKSQGLRTKSSLSFRKS